MFAVSRNGNQIHVFDPRSGLRVPVTVDLRTGKLAIAAPSAEELHEDFIAVHDGDELRSVAPPQHVKAAVDFSRVYSHIFGKVLDDKNLSIAGLRTMITSHFRRQAEPDLGAAYLELRERGDLSLSLQKLKSIAVI